jgi:hypothetical protein
MTINEVIKKVRELLEKDLTPLDEEGIKAALQVADEEINEIVVANGELHLFSAHSTYRLWDEPDYPEWLGTDSDFFDEFTEIADS